MDSVCLCVAFDVDIVVIVKRVVINDGNLDSKGRIRKLSFLVRGNVLFLGI